MTGPTTLVVTNLTRLKGGPEKEARSPHTAAAPAAERGAPPSFEDAR
jgi:hypothetical protein